MGWAQAETVNRCSELFNYYLHGPWHGHGLHLVNWTANGWDGSSTLGAGQHGQHFLCEKSGWGFKRSIPGSPTLSIRWTEDSASSMCCPGEITRCPSSSIYCPGGIARWSWALAKAFCKIQQHSEWLKEENDVMEDQFRYLQNARKGDANENKPQQFHSQFWLWVFLKSCRWELR